MDFSPSDVKRQDLVGSHEARGATALEEMGVALVSSCKKVFWGFLSLHVISLSYKAPSCCHVTQPRDLDQS